MKKWTLLYNFGNMLDKIALVVAVIAVITGIVGLIIGAAWTGSAWNTFLYILLGSFSWFMFSLLFLAKKVKEEK